jgi:hypothetical protein
VKDFDALFPHVMPYAPGCPEPTAMQHLRNAAAELCETSRLWRSTDDFDVTEGEQSILVAPSGADIFEIEYASIDGQKLRPVSRAWLDEQLPQWRTLTGTPPKYITQDEPDTVRLVPSGAGRLSLEYYLTISDDAEQLPDFIVDKYARAVADGALAMILLLPKKSFTDPAMAAVFQSRWDSVLGKSGRANLKGQQRAPVRTRAQFF